jgi:hypothetical protein
MSALVLIFSTNVFAKVVSFKCTSTNAPDIHKFDANGVFSVDANNVVEGFANIKVQKAEVDQSIQTFDELKLKGYLRRFDAGDISKDDFIQLVLTSDNVYIKSLNLLLNLEEENNSSIVLSIDNFSFRSNCKIIDE